ncbi:MAG: hypothetical protein ACI85K_002856, partial [Hyphomicrobiaceae bacterium]
YLFEAAEKAAEPQAPKDSGNKKKGEGQ